MNLNKHGVAITAVLGALLTGAVRFCTRSEPPPRRFDPLGYEAFSYTVISENGPWRTPIESAGLQAYGFHTANDKVRVLEVASARLDEAEKAQGPLSSGLIEDIVYLAFVCKVCGEFQRSASLLERAQSLLRDSTVENREMEAILLNNLAWLRRAQMRYGLAEDLYQRSLVMCEQAFGPQHLYTATILDNFAELYQATGRPEMAEDLRLRAAEIRLLDAAVK